MQHLRQGSSKSNYFHSTVYKNHSHSTHLIKLIAHNVKVSKPPFWLSLVIALHSQTLPWHQCHVCITDAITLVQSKQIIHIPFKVIRLYLHTSESHSVQSNRFAWIRPYYTLYRVWVRPQRFAFEEIKAQVSVQCWFTNISDCHSMEKAPHWLIEYSCESMKSTLHTLYLSSSTDLTNRLDRWL